MVKRLSDRHIRRYIKGAVLGTMGFCTSWAVDVVGRGKEWIEVVDVNIKIEGLSQVFDGLRIAHISDLHCSRTVSTKYLRGCIERVNQLGADVVFLTGDFITHDFYGKFTRKVVDLVKEIEAKKGVYACPGNHDYGINGLFGVNAESNLEQMSQGFEKAGVSFLRNSSAIIRRGSNNLRIVGVGDLWAEDFDPEMAFAGANGEGSIVLSHNPAGVDYLGDYNVSFVMSGHTHGMEYEWKIAKDKPVVRRRFYTEGMYEVEGRKLYVNRGLGRHGRAINKRPEITLFNLNCDKRELVR